MVSNQYDATSRRGQEYERACLEAALAARADWPEWMHSVRLSTHQEDVERKWDVVAETNRGPIGVQIKGCRGSSVTEHKKLHPEVPLLLMRNGKCKPKTWRSLANGFLRCASVAYAAISGGP